MGKKKDNEIAAYAIRLDVGEAYNLLTKEEAKFSELIHSLDGLYGTHQKNLRSSYTYLLFDTPKNRKTAYEKFIKLCPKTKMVIETAYIDKKYLK